MRITYIKGDLFTTDCDAIVHGCNNQGVMGSGVAKLIRLHYPEAYEYYRKQYSDNASVLGQAQFVKAVDGKLIINGITQEYYGRDGKQYVDYNAIAKVMGAINRRYDIQTVAMPMIGAGLGGGDWTIIEKIIETELTFIKPYVYSL